MNSTSTPDIGRLAPTPVSGAETGFTLLEVLIAFAILLFITLMTYQKIGQTYMLRDRLLTQGDFINSITMAVGILDRDISMLYSPVMMIPEKDKTAPGANGPSSTEEQEAIAWGDQKRGSEYWHGVVDPTGIRAMHFIGEPQSLSFVAASHGRIYKEARESIFAKVRFELREDQFAPEDARDTKALIKLSNPNAFEMERDDTDEQHVYRLLSGVKELKFEFYEKDRDRWLSRWDSDSQEFKYKYPDLIRMTIEVEGEGKNVQEGTYYFRTEIPIHGFFPTF